MAKYKLTITDMESGEIMQENACDGIMGATICKESDDSPSPEAFAIGFQLSIIEELSLLMALDINRDRFLGENPAVALAYRLKDEIFKKRVVVDISELKKQAGSL